MPGPRTGIFDLDQVGGVTVVHFTTPRLMGDKAVQGVGERLHRLVEEGWHRQVVVDLDKIEAMNSTMIAKLITLHRKARASGGRVVLCGLRPELLEVFQTLQLHRLLPVYEDRDKALQSFPPAGEQAAPAPQPDMPAG